MLDDVLPGNSKAVGVKLFLSWVILSQEEEDDNGGENEPGNENSTSLFVLLKQTICQLEQNKKMTIIAFWLDSNKELNYLCLSMRVIHGLQLYDMLITG